jgi:hypothetical protein
MLCRFFIALVIFWSCGTTLNAQTSAETPVDHMEYLSHLEQELSKKYLSYMSEVAHGGKARKMEKRREDVINSVRISIREAGKLRPYNGDASLRDAYKSYWNVLLSVFNEDYHKIVNIEEIAEKSYDEMEAYLLIQEEAGEKLNAEHERLRTVYDEFAAKNNVRLVEGQNKLSKKLDQTGKVNKYMNQVFLIIFKSAVQEEKMIEAFNAKDVAGVEQAKASLLKYAEEGLSRLDTLKPFNGDGSMVTACRKILEFQRDEAKSRFDAHIAYLMKADEMDRLKKNIEAKPANSRTAEDIDTYNKTIQDFNKLVADYNKANTSLNASRDKVRNNYEISRKTFIGRHTPHA